MLQQLEPRGSLLWAQLGPGAFMHGHLSCRGLDKLASLFMLAQGHPASDCWDQSLVRDCVAPEPVFYARRHRAASQWEGSPVCSVAPLLLAPRPWAREPLPQHCG